MRCFVAIEAPEGVRDAMVRVQEDLRRADADVKWVERENLHLTLKFLGELADPAPLAGALAGIRHPPVRLDFGGVGLFPRVVWVGCFGRLAALAEEVERAAEAVGLPRESRPFEPHLTLGRIKSRRNEKRLRAMVGERRASIFGGSEAKAFALRRSTLTPRGPVYETLREFPLGPSAAHA